MTMRLLSRRKKIFDELFRHIGCLITKGAVSLMKKTVLFAVMITLILSSIAFTSCAEVSSEKEVMTAARNLIDRSYTVNEVCFGEGLPYQKDGVYVEYLAAAIGVTVDELSYYPISDSAEFQSVNEIKAYAANVYSSEYCEFLFKRTFEGLSDNDEVAIYPRYIEQYDMMTVRPDGGGMVIKELRSFDLDSIEIVKIKPKYALIRVEAYRGGESIGTVSLKLVHEEVDGIMCWRLDTPTY